MFMTDYEQVYGKNAGQSSEYTGPYYSEEEKKKGEFLKKAGAAAVAAGQLAGNAASSAAGTAKVLAGNAADYLKSDDAKAKMNAAKGKALAFASGAGSAFSGLKGKAAAFVNERKKSAEESAHVADEPVTYNDIPVDISDEEIIDNTNIESGSSILPEADNVPDMTDDDNIELQEAEDDSSPAPTVQRLPEPKQSAVNTPMDTPASYSYQEEKKSPIVYILIGIIALLLVVVGVLGGMFFMKKNKSDKNDSDTNGNSISTENSEALTEYSETTTDSFTTEATAIDEVSEPEITIPAVSEEEFNSALDAFLASFGGSSSDPVSDTQYALYDVNNDGIKELFVKAEYIAGNYTTMYQYENSGFVSTDASGENVKICTDDTLIECDRFGGGAVYAYYLINNDKKVVLADQLYSYAGQYYHGDNVISEAEFNSLLAEKNKLSWLEPSYTYFTVQSQPQSQNANIPASYSGYENIQNAPADMVFYEGNDIQTGTIITESTGLNMRSGPGSEYEIILEIPKGDSVDILGTSNDWCYVKWSVYAAGLRQDIDYYGYISKQYVSVGNSTSSQITPVEKYGTIYSPADSKVDGYAKSYLIDGGAETYVRHDLTHGWHIKAVNEYNNGIFNYYELYDADDGDYYGWVNEEQISFY